MCSGSTNDRDDVTTDSGTAPAAEPDAATAMPQGWNTVEAYDFPKRRKPTACYVVTTTRRSGSTFLCHQLWSTGLLGAPLEYFHYAGTMLQMVSRLQANSMGQYIQRLFEVRTSPSGVFGFKAHWDQFQLLINSGSLRLFPNLRFIHLERRDAIAQAVSYARARQTGQWAMWRESHQTAAYDADSIRYCLRRIEQENAKWRAMFARGGRKPINLAYEDLVAGPSAVVDAILGQFGVARDPARHLDLPMTERQSDSLNREWIERFRREQR